MGASRNRRAEKCVSSFTVDALIDQSRSGNVSNDKKKTQEEREKGRHQTPGLPRQTADWLERNS